jgi:hypothetical protein
MTELGGGSGRFPKFVFTFPAGREVVLTREDSLKLAIDIGTRFVDPQVMERVRETRERPDLRGDAVQDTQLGPEEILASAMFMMQDALALLAGDCPAYCTEQLPPACKKPFGGARMYWVCDHRPTSHQRPYP